MSIIIGFLTLTGCGVAISTVDLSECDLLLSACFLEFHLEDGEATVYDVLLVFVEAPVTTAVLHT